MSRADRLDGTSINRLCRGCVRAARFFRSTTDGTTFGREKPRPECQFVAHCVIGRSSAFGELRPAKLAGGLLAGVAGTFRTADSGVGPLAPATEIIHIGFKSLGHPRGPESRGIGRCGRPFLLAGGACCIGFAGYSSARATWATRRRLCSTGLASGRRPPPCHPRWRCGFRPSRPRCARSARPWPAYRCASTAPARTARASR